MAGIAQEALLWWHARSVGRRTRPEISPREDFKPHTNVEHPPLSVYPVHRILGPSRPTGLFFFRIVVRVIRYCDAFAVGSTSLLLVMPARYEALAARTNVCVSISGPWKPGQAVYRPRIFSTSTAVALSSQLEGFRAGNGKIHEGVPQSFFFVGSLFRGSNDYGR